MQNFEKLKNCSIKEATSFLQEYITHIYQDPISEKANAFFNNFTEILFLIFGYENQPGWLEKAYRQYTDNENRRASTAFIMADMDLKSLITLLAPSRSKQHVNLFSLVMENFTNSRYYFNESNLPQFTQSLLLSKSYNHYILKEYDGLFGFVKDSRDARFTKDKVELILNPYEFYLFVFVYSMKKFKTITLDPKTPYDCLKSDFVSGLLKNPYLILLRKYLDFFFNENSYNFTQRGCFRKLVFLIEDYCMNDLIYTPTVIPGKISVSNKLQPSGKFEQKYDVIMKNIPSPHIFHALTITLHYLNKILNPFTDAPTNSNVYLYKNIDDARSMYSKLFYHFFLTCLKFWNKDLNNPTSIADFGRLWFAYLKPWECYPPNEIDDLAIYDYIAPVSENPNQPDNVNNEEYANKYLIMRPKGSEKQFLTNKEYYNTLNHFFTNNLLFYTGLFKELIIVLSEINILHYKDIVFFKELLEFLNFEKTGEEQTMLSGHIKLEYLKYRGSNLGTKSRVDLGYVIRKHVEEMGADYSDLYFMEDDSIKTSRVEKLIQKFEKYKISFIKSTMSNRNDFKPVHEGLDEMVAELSRSLRHQIFFIRDAKKMMAQTPSNIPREFGIKNMNVKAEPKYENPWMKPVSNKDVKFLYYLFYDLAYYYDKFVKGVEIDEDDVDVPYYPTSNLRPLSDKIMIMRVLLVVFIAYVVMKALFYSDYSDHSFE